MHHRHHRHHRLHHLHYHHHHQHHSQELHSVGHGSHPSCISHSAATFSVSTSDVKRLSDKFILWSAGERFRSVLPVYRFIASLTFFFRYLGTLSRLVFCSQSFVLRSSSFQFSKLFQRIAKLLRTMQITSFYTMSSASTQRTSLNQTALGAGCRSLHWLIHGGALAPLWAMNNDRASVLREQWQHHNA